MSSAGLSQEAASWTHPDQTASPGPSRVQCPQPCLSQTRALPRPGSLQSELLSLCMCRGECFLRNKRGGLQKSADTKATGPSPAGFSTVHHCSESWQLAPVTLLHATSHNGSGRPWLQQWPRKFPLNPRASSCSGSPRVQCGVELKRSEVDVPSARPAWSLWRTEHSPQGDGPQAPPQISDSPAVQPGRS